MDKTARPTTQEPSSPTDQELVREAKKGNENSFDELVRRYQQKIYNLAWRMVRNQEDARELSQETFVRAYYALRKFKEQSSFYTWLYRICFNLCISFLKKSQKKPNIASIDTMTEDQLILESVSVKSAILEPDAISQRQNLANVISRALDQLPLKQKMVFMMRQYDGLNNEEIAKVLGLSISGVKSNYHHAIKKLQILLKEWL